MPNFSFRNPWVIFHELDRRHDHTRRAIATLQGMMLAEGLLHRVQRRALRAQTLDGQDLRIRRLQRGLQLLRERGIHIVGCGLFWDRVLFSNYVSQFLDESFQHRLDLRAVRGGTGCIRQQQNRVFSTQTSEQLGEDAEQNRLVVGKGAVEVEETQPQIGGGVFVTVLPDSGAKYASDRLWRETAA